MTTFAYTTGNPANLTGGANASMNDIQGPFTDVRTFLNGANLSDTQLVSPNNAVWRTLAGQGFYITSASNAAAYWFQGNDGGNVVTGGTGYPAPINLDPAEYAVAGKTAKLRLRVNMLIGGAPGTNPVFGIYGISAVSGTTSIAVTLGSVVAGSTVTFAPPAQISLASGAFDFPASVGQYVFGVNLPGPSSAGSFVSGRLQLSISHV